MYYMYIVKSKTSTVFKVQVEVIFYIHLWLVMCFYICVS